MNKPTRYLITLRFKRTGDEKDSFQTSITTDIFTTIIDYEKRYGSTAVICAMKLDE